MIIALTHMRDPNDIRLAEEVPEIHLVLGGHDHHYFEKKVELYCIIRLLNMFHFLLFEKYLLIFVLLAAQTIKKNLNQPTNFGIAKFSYLIEICSHIILRGVWLWFIPVSARGVVRLES